MYQAQNKDEFSCQKCVQLSDKTFIINRVEVLLCTQCIFHLREPLFIVIIQKKKEDQRPPLSYSFDFHKH